MSHRIKNATLEDGFARNPDKIYHEEYFKYLPLSNGELVLANGNTDFTLFQPANTFIKEIFIVCHTAAAFSGSSNVGISVHNSAYNNIGSGNVVAGTSTNVLSNGTDIAINTLISVSLETTATVKYTPSNRSLFCRVTCSAAPSTAGKFFVVPIFCSLNSSVYLGSALYSILGTNAHSCEYDVSNGFGGVKLSTSAAASDQAIIFPNLTKNTPLAKGVLRPGRRLDFETSIIVPDITTVDYGIMAGLSLSVPTTLTSTLTEDNDKAMFIFGANAAFTSGSLSSNANLLFVYSISGNEYATDLGLPIVAGREYQLKIKFNKQKKMTIFVNDAQFGLTTTQYSSGNYGSTATNSYTESEVMNDVALYPVVGVQTTSGNSRSLVVNYLKASRDAKKI